MRPDKQLRVPTAYLIVGWTIAIVAPGFETTRAQAPGRVSVPKTGHQPAPTADRAADRTAIRAVMASFAKAFESRDATALAAYWTAEGELEKEDGETLQGRETIEKAFAEFFSKTPEVKAEIQSESLRFVSGTCAIDEGTVKVRRGPAAPATSSLYSALFVHEDSHWRVARLSELTADEVSMTDLGWLVGEWKSASGQGAEIRTTYSWAPSKKFLNVQFAIREKDLSLSGNQVIGVDPATGEIHAWTFEADGGVGEADWFRDGDHWVLEAAGTLADGSSLSETNILRRVNDDTFTWQSVDRLLDDTELPDLPPVKVTRVTSK